MNRDKSEDYVRQLMQDLKGETVGKKIGVLKDEVLYWHNSSLFCREVYEELQEIKEIMRCMKKR